MNKLFLEHYMHTAPEGTEQKYIFLTDDREIAFNIIAAGYKAVLIFLPLVCYTGFIHRLYEKKRRLP